MIEVLLEGAAHLHIAPSHARRHDAGHCGGYIRPTESAQGQRHSPRRHWAHPQSIHADPKAAPAGGFAL